MSKKQQNQQESSSEKNKKRAAAYMKYSGMAIQMGAIILIGTYFGRYLDQHFETPRPYLTVLFSLLSIFAALYVTLKDIINEK